MDAGLITNPKDLERMTHELTSLERRISDLEDVELEVMERLEEAQQEQKQLVAELAEAEERLASVTAERDRRTTQINDELGSIATRRTETVQDMPEDLLALYERIRAGKGVGAALLRAGACEGCRLSLTAADLGAIAKAPVDEVVRCEECGRILVRTAESGL